MTTPNNRYSLVVFAWFLSSVLCSAVTRADYILTDGETKTFTSATDFGALNQNVTGPSTGLATVNFNLTGDLNPLTGAFTGNLAINKSGGNQIRMYYDYATSGKTPFSGPVKISAGFVYVQYGQELGTGKITLAGGGLSNGGNGWKSITNATMTNAIEFQASTTSYVRFAKGGGNINFTGNLTGTGASVWGMTSTTYGEPEPSVVTLSGDASAYSGTVTFNHNYDSKKVAAKYVVSNANGFGTGAVNVNQPTEIDYTTAATVKHSTVTVASGKTLTLKNSGGNAVSITAKLPTDASKQYGVIDLAGSNINMTISGHTKEQKIAGNVKIGSGSSLTFAGTGAGDNLYPNITLTGSGNLYFTDVNTMFRLEKNSPDFTGNVYIQAGRIYLNTGKELGTGTIYLGGTKASLQNNSSNIDVPNNIVLVDGTTGYLRPYRSTTTSKFRGNITGGGSLVYGNNVFTQEGDNSVVELYGTNTYTGSTTFNQGGTNAFQVKVYGTQGFGTNDVIVKNNVKITYQNDADGKTVNRTLTHSAIQISEGKTLELANAGSGTVELRVSALKSDSGKTIGTLNISGANINLTVPYSGSVTTNGKLTVADGSSLTIEAAKDASLTWGTTLNGAGDLHLKGTENAKFYFKSTTLGTSGDVYIESGRVYLQNGKELGTGTIYLGGTNASLQNNGGTVDVPNNIVLVDGKTGYLRPFGSGSKTSLRGNITGSGNLVYGYNVYTREADNSKVHLYGNNTYTGTTTFDHRTDSNYTKGFFTYVYGENGFGSGAMQVNELTYITFCNASDGSALNRKVQNSSITLATGKELNLANTGSGQVSVLGSVTNNGTITLTEGKISFAQKLTGTGSLVVNSGATLGIGAYDATKGTALELTETGGFTLSGKLGIDLFSPTDYDSLVLNSSATNTIGEDAFIEVTVQNPEKFSNQLVAVSPIKNLDAQALNNLQVRFLTDGFSGYIQNGQLFVGDRNALPEPATWVLLVLGLGLMWKVRKK